MEAVEDSPSLLVVYVEKGRQHWALYAGGEEEFKSDIGSLPGIIIYLKAWVRSTWVERRITEETWEIVKAEPHVAIKEMI